MIFIDFACGTSLLKNLCSIPGIRSRNVTGLSSISNIEDSLLFADLLPRLVVSIEGGLMGGNSP